MTMLNNFVVWATQKVGELNNVGAHVTVTRGAMSPNPAARMDIDTQDALARITFWDDGNAVAEVIALDSDETKYTRRFTLASPSEFDAAFSEFFSFLGLRRAA